MGIASYIEDVLPEGITYEIEVYNLKDKICDDDDNTKCTLNAEKTFYITFKYVEGTSVSGSSDYSVALELDFQKFYNVIYSSNICVGCASEAIANTSFSVTLINYNIVTVKINGISLIEGYTFNQGTGVLTIDNVNGDISIINTTYTRLEYIESTGTAASQFIDTGYTPNKNTTVVYDGMVISGDTALFGVREAANVTRVQRFTLQYVGSNYYRASFRNNDFKISNSYLKEQRHIFKMDGYNAYIDNTIVTTFTSGLIDDFKGVGSLYLLAINSGGSASNFGSVRVYSFKVYENDVLIKNYIPVLNLENKPCLYETFDKTYHCSTSTTPLNYQQLSQHTITNNITNISSSDTQTYVLFGDTYDTILTKTNESELPTSIKVTSSGIPLIKDQDFTYDSTTGRLIIPNISGNIVISEIVSTKLDYIESTGTQYINTGYVPGPNTKVVFTHIPTVSRFSSWAAYFGYRNGDTNEDSLYASSGSDTTNASVVSAYVGGVHMAPSGNVPFTHTVGATEVITLSSNEFSIVVDGISRLSITKVSETELSMTNNGVTTTIPTTTTTPVFDTVGPMFIFARNTGKNDANFLSTVKLVSFQIYENNELEMDFEPIIDENGDIGLIENESGEYFYNQGSGVFLQPVT